MRRVELYIDPSETGSTLLSGTLVPSQESAPLILLRLACSCFDLRWMKAPPVDLSCRPRHAHAIRPAVSVADLRVARFRLECFHRRRPLIRGNFRHLRQRPACKARIACVLWRMASRLHRRSSICRSCHGPHRTQAGRSGVARRENTGAATASNRPLGESRLALASFRCLISAAPETSRVSRTGHKRSAAQRCETEP